MSTAGPADTPNETSATEFVIEEFDTTVPDNAVEDLAERITEIVRDLRSEVVSDDRLEELIHGQPGLDILHGNDLTEHGERFEQTHPDASVIETISQLGIDPNQIERVEEVLA